VAIVSIGILAIVVMLGLIAAGYWRYVNDLPPFTPPAVRMPVPNGYTQAEQLIAKLSQTQRPQEPPTWPSGTPPELEAQLTPIRPCLDAMRATLRLEWRGPLRQSDAYVMPGFQECTRCFVAEGNLARHQGDYATAMQRYLDGMELGGKVSDGGGADVWLVGTACHVIGFAGAERLVLSLPVRAVPAALQRVRQIREGWPRLADMLENERVLTLGQSTASIQRLQRQPLPVQILSFFNEHTTAWKATQLALTPRRLPLSNIDRYYRECIANSKKPVRHRTMVPAPRDPWWPSATSLLTDLWWSDSWRWENRLNTQLTLLAVALAVRQHYLERGAYPKQLRDINRKWLPAIPADCWGQPVAYRLKNGRPLIYSLGPDGKNDGGQAADPLGLTPQARGDLVFGQLSRRTPPSSAATR
jgi:hypothetical protein